MRNATIKSLMNRIEAIARKEYRDIVGQLQCMLDMYEGKTAPKEKRAYTKRKAKAIPTTPEIKVDGRSKRKPLTAQQKKNISMGIKLAHARKKLSDSQVSTH